MDSATPTARAAASASAGEPVAEPTLAATNAVISILPSRPRSITPARSHITPASAHRISGVATRSVLATSVPSRLGSSHSVTRWPRQLANGAAADVSNPAPTTPQ